VAALKRFLMGFRWEGKDGSSEKPLYPQIIAHGRQRLPRGQPTCADVR
jgi:hypothetical protein